MGNKIELSKGRTILLIVAVCMSAIITAGELIISPITYNLYEEIHASTTLINLIISGPPLVMIFTSLLVPFISKAIGEKNAMILGAILFTVSGVLGFQIMNIGIILAWRTINAISQAIMNVTAIIVINKVFGNDEKKTATITGLYTAAISVFCASLSAASGVLASMDWTKSFLCYWSGAIAFVMILLFIPSLKKLGQTREEEVKTIKSKEPMGWKFWVFVLMLAIYYVCYCVPSYFTSVYVAENGLGNEAVSGMAVSVANIASLISGLIFGIVFTKIKQNISVFSYAIVAIALGLMYFFHSTPIVFIANFMEGFTMSIMYAFAFTFGPILVPGSKVATAISIVAAVSGAGQFLATFFVTFLMKLFHTDLVTPIFVVPFVIMVVMVIVEFSLRKNDKRLFDHSLTDQS